MGRPPIDEYDSGHFADATEEQLAGLLEAIDGLAKPQISTLVSWARGQYNFMTGNENNISFYVSVGRGRKKNDASLRAQQAAGQP